jgi:hypothetical protein
MFLDHVAPGAEQQDRSRDRHDLLSELVSVFARCFPSIRYRVLGSVNVVNAQASVAQDGPLVDLLGGLVFHRAIGREGLLWTLLHETGHHLGKGSRLPWADLACECTADRWALTSGRKRLCAEGVEFDLGTALGEIERASRPPNGRRRSKPANGACVATSWRKRKQALIEGHLSSQRRCQILGMTQD